ncbi:hypothetical protein KDN32_10515 [Nocardioides sp. J2M5]|uniref:hypothetical protein n=1 Tax=Nocardioides palaemonis TaxID=2829810 RepID=UPI001BAA9FB9|nr:hypothetical protein [Nocardioides palaemonis]MBS2938177.1 hypothetical protein [Nocardioides palaemonis]
MLESAVPLLLLLVLWALAALVVYWIIRLGVRHGTLDAYRIDRTDQRIAQMQAEGRGTGGRQGLSGPS